MEWIEWIGYIASLIVLVSLVMKSLKKLRVINLFGALIFALYALMITSFPVFLMNIGIVIINLYYLKQMYGSKDYFELIKVNPTDAFALAFIEYYQDDIKTYMPLKDAVLKNSTYRYMIVRNMHPAGLFIAQAIDEETLEITLDYATPHYQDFKTGPYVFEKINHVLKAEGYKRLIAYAEHESHHKYLMRMGFKKDSVSSKNKYLKTL